MPHRVSYKKDLGTAHKFSDSYDIDNIYLSEEGWVYRHFKNSERTLWWDEIIVAGQVNPDQVIHGVPNNDVVPTNPLKLGTAIPSEFQEGDKYFDYRYSDHEGAPDKIVIGPEDKPNNHNQIPWLAIVGSANLAGVVEGDTSTQVPHGWTGPSTPSDPAYPDSPDYAANLPQPEAVYVVKENDPMPATPPPITEGTFEDGSGGNEVGPTPEAS